MEIKTKNGNVVLLDDDSVLCGHKLALNRAGYPVFLLRRKLTRLNRAIMNAPTGTEVDHINGNVLDNRKSNLRICSHRQNMQNRKTVVLRAVKGVGWHKGAGKFRAYITVNGERRHLGLFDELCPAIEAYDTAAVSSFGEYARTNTGRI